MVGRRSSWEGVHFRRLFVLFILGGRAACDTAPRGAAPHCNLHCACLSHPPPIAISVLSLCPTLQHLEQHVPGAQQRGGAALLPGAVQVPLPHPAGQHWGGRGLAGGLLQLAAGLLQRTARVLRLVLGPSVRHLD